MRKNGKDTGIKEPTNARREASGPLKPAPRKDRRETEAKLFRAGVQVMSALGYEGATTKRIAEIAGVNEQLISRYFGGKEALLVAIMRSYKASEFAREHTSRPAVAPTLHAEIFSFLIEADFPAENEPFARLAMGRAVVDARIAQAINDLRADCYRPMLTERLEAHRALGNIDPTVDLPTVIEALIHARLGLAAYGRMLFHVGSAQLQKMSEMFADVFARALAPQGTASDLSPAATKAARAKKRR